METEELTKLVDGIYKNILDKFNPGARQMINAGKAYLKALHGAAAASRLYVDAITKLARQAQQGTWGGSADIGTALMRIVEVYKEIQEQQMNILKAFYVDMLVPLETNLEKDTKVVQSEQKRFLQQHKARSESYSKAAAAIKKQRKKTRASAGSKAAMAMDKELKTMQVLEEEKSKLDAFCEQSLKNAMTQERRRYGFVLERQCSLAKHYLSYHTNGMQIYQQNIDDWSEVAKTREFLPESVENMFSSRMRQVSFWPDEDVYSNPRSPQLDDDRLSITSQLRKTKSMDASCLDIRSIGDAGSPMLSLSRAKSEFNLTASTHSLIQDCATPQRRPKSMAVLSNQGSLQWDTQLARALYAYLSSGENQLSFLEGDVIALMGDRNKGWQYGENLRTQCSGWFPLAYTEIILDDSILSPTHRISESQASGHLTPVTPTNGSGISSTNSHYSNNQEKSINENSNTRMFGDTLNLHRSLTNSKQIRRVTAAHSSCPPPSLPAPVPTPTLPFPKSSASTMPHSQSTSFNQTSYSQSNTNPSIKTSTSTFNFTTPTSGSYSTHPQGTRTTERIAQTSTTINSSKTGKVGPAVGNISLHSSNDSGFSNDPPPQPEIDYSDDDITIQNSANRVPIRTSTRQKNDNNNNNKVLHNGNNEYPTRSGSYGTLLDQNRSHHSSSPYNNQATLMRSMRVSGSEKRGIIKRTKSFWKFGKNTENEILEGMALWKHRDLVDVQRDIAKNKPKTKAHPQQNPLPQNALPQNALPQNGTMDRTDRHSGSEKSNDSDRTLQNAKPSESIYIEKPEIKSNENDQVEETPIVKKKAIEGVQKTTDSDFENEFIDGVADTEDNFFDDDGLMLRVKTINRKNILQQYNNDDEIMSESENIDSDSVVSSDDPYDCIVVDDHTATTNEQKKNSKKQTDTKSKSKKPINKVAEIGKKLEKLAKSTKYSQKENPIRKSSDVNVERRRSLPRSSRKMSEQREHTFRTFGHDEKRRSMQEPSKREREREKRYDQNTTENIYGETQQSENRQIIPRTKLVKSNSVGTAAHESDDNGLMEYGQSLQKRLKHPDTKYQEISPETGNMYGPWYDLWGMDSSVKNMPITKKRMSRNPREENIYGEKF